MSDPDEIVNTIAAGSRTELENLQERLAAAIERTRDPSTLALLWNTSGMVTAQLARKFQADTAGQAVAAFRAAADHLLFTIASAESQQSFTGILQNLIQALMLPGADVAGLESVTQFINRHRNAPPLSRPEALAEVQARLGSAFLHHALVREDQRPGLARRGRQLMEAAMSHELPDAGLLYGGALYFNYLTALVMTATRPDDLRNFADTAIAFDRSPGVALRTPPLREHAVHQLAQAGATGDPALIARQAWRLWQAWAPDFLEALVTTAESGVPMLPELPEWGQLLLAWDVQRAVLATRQAKPDLMRSYTGWLTAVIGYPAPFAALIGAYAEQEAAPPDDRDLSPSPARPTSVEALVLERELPQWRSADATDLLAALHGQASRRFGWDGPADDAAPEQFFVSEINDLLVQLTDQDETLRAAGILRRIEAEEIMTFSRLRLAIAMYRRLIRWTYTADAAGLGETESWLRRAGALAAEVISGAGYEEIELELAYRARAEAATQLLHVASHVLALDAAALDRMAEEAIAAYRDRFSAAGSVVTSLNANLAYTRASSTIAALNRGEQREQPDTEAAFAVFLQVFLTGRRESPADPAKVGIQAGNAILLAAHVAESTAMAHRHELLDASHAVLTRAGLDPPPVLDLHIDAVLGLMDDPLRRIVAVDRALLADTAARLATAIDPTRPDTAARMRRRARRLVDEDSAGNVDHALATWRRMTSSGDLTDAVRELQFWLLEMLQVPSYQFGRTVGVHMAGRQVGYLLRYLPAPDRMTLVRTAYLVADSARYAGQLDLSAAWYSVLLAPRPDDPEPVRALLAVVRHDHMQMLVQHACSKRDQQAAVRALRDIAGMPHDGEHDPRRQLLTALAIVVAEFGATLDGDEFIVSVDSLLDDACATAADADWAQLASVLRGHLALAEVWSRPSQLDKLILLCSRVLDRGVDADREAELLRARAYCHRLRGEIARNTRDLERITFLQDELLAHGDPLDKIRGRDLVRESLVASACSALAEGSPQVAVDIAELGRARALSVMAERVRAHSRVGWHNPPRRWVTDGGMSPLLRWFTDALAGRFTGEALTAEQAGWLDFDWLRGFFPEGHGPAVVSWSLAHTRAGFAEAAALSARVGIVTYQIVRRETLHLVHLVGPGAVVYTGGIDLGAADHLTRLFESWRSAFDAWSDAPTPELQPVVIDVGGLAGLPARHRRAVAALTGSYALANRPGGGLLSYLPTVRLAVTADRDRAGGRPTGPIRILHIGDDTSTLIGPWMEAAALAAQNHVEVISLVGADVSMEKFAEHAGWATIIVASCHGSFDQSDPLATVLSIGLSLADIATDAALADVSFFLVAACNAGRRGDTAYEREAFSFATAALAGGCTWAAAPIAPVNDLASALLVTDFVTGLRDQEPPNAFADALAGLQSCPEQVLQERAAAAWNRLQADAGLVSRMPWPIWAVSGTVEARIRELRRGGTGATENYVLFGAGTRERSASGAPQPGHPS
ncbi:CHAT domain-containing protein [Paractinoplanes rishiriensis]|uniref:CHAT domain-containing protein n=1 Tax=Paractinoplanes rishiriensis TaxID=1050105 RepID=A0A919JXS2_9ACTN|nr:CHAT domain-containing protein [Actinoplanes rishiriensis]GIE95247.1 hypothetical protein Ari01nite_27120 [Actinoplanes rishiriensis]